MSRAMLPQYKSPKTMNMDMILDPTFSKTVPSTESVLPSTTDRRIMTSMSGRE